MQLFPAFNSLSFLFTFMCLASTYQKFQVGRQMGAYSL